MKILGHRHTGIIVNDFDVMLKFYVDMGLVLRRRDLEQGPFIDGLLGTKGILVETAKLVLEDKNNPIGYSFQLELMKIKNGSSYQKNDQVAFNFLARSSGILDLAFTVDDITAFRSFITLNGGDLIGEPLEVVSGFPALHCYARDPEGNVLHLAQNLDNPIKTQRDQ
jgi:catechol 2,3-dioxygenase-like lactoylglutathione lyase family enzyme